MANASKNSIGKGAPGKGAGVGAMTDAQEEMIEDNITLSNRDKSQHPKERGLDSRGVKNEQRQDHESNRRVDPE
jgi:hypothetical protein